MIESGQCLLRAGGGGWFMLPHVAPPFRFLLCLQRDIIQYCPVQDQQEIIVIPCLEAQLRYVYKFHVAFWNQF